MRIREFGPLEMRVDEAGPPEMGVHEVGLFQDGAAKIEMPIAALSRLRLCSLRRLSTVRTAASPRNSSACAQTRPTILLDRR